MADAPQDFPPGGWFAAVADGAPQFVAFRDIEGGTELVEADWVKENVFDILAHPLLVDGVSMGDRVEVSWEAGDPTPRFLSVRRPGGQRTVRVRATEHEVERFLHHVKEYKEEGLDIFAWGYRYERGVLVFGVYDFVAEDLKNVYHLPLSRLLPGEWVFTDTGTQE